MTERTQPTLRFEASTRGEIAARFDGGTIRSDRGAPLFAGVGQRPRIVERFASCFVDRRDPARIEHSARELALRGVRQVQESDEPDPPRNLVGGRC